MARAYTLAELAGPCGAELHGDPAVEVVRVAPLATAGTGELSFLSGAAHRHHLPGTRAAAVILAATDLEDCPVPALVCANPYAAYARAAQLLYPEPTAPPGVHPSAVVGAGCEFGEGVSIGANAVLGDGCRLGQDVVVGPCCVLGDGVSVGDGSRLVANVTLSHGVRVGRRTLLQPGAVIGADGFGFANDAGRWLKIPQVGSVIIGDDVEIGANSTIDRGALGDTVIGDGVKIDNLVMVAHNVRIGAGSALAGCVGIAGSAVIGERCTVGGGVGITGHIEVADDVHVTGMSFVNRSVDTSGVYSSGMPLQDNRAWRKNMTRLKQLDELARRVRELERKRDEKS